MKIALRIGIFVVAIAGFVGMKFYGKSKSSDQIKGDMKKIVAQLQGYKEDKKYVDDLFEKAHPAAFEAAFSLGGRRSSSNFNDKLYIKELYGAMIPTAEKDDKKELAAYMKLQLIQIEEALKQQEGGQDPPAKEEGS